MIPARHYVGESRTPVLTVDGAGPDPDAIKAMATALSPFPPATNNYPGVRRMLDEKDHEAWAYVVAILEAVSPYIAGAFDIGRFDLVEASFSLVTLPPALLSPVQRAPHFDSVDEDLIAILHYIAPCAGTAFYRHRATGLELMSAQAVDAYVAMARRESAHAEADYIRADNAAYARIGMVDGLAGRLVAYPARLLHSGIIPPGYVGSDQPEHGRLTCNIFVRLH